MDTGSLVQPGREFALSEIAEELGGDLEVPAVPVMTAGYADIYHGVWITPQGERFEVAVKELKPLIPKDRQTDPAHLAWKADMLFQTACGLEHLHAQKPPICHADVKPENVLMNDFQGPTLSDFGLSRVLRGLDEPSGFSTSETVKGTLRYKAAELFAGQKPSLESDVYAFGGLILTVMSGKAPFYGLDEHVIMRRVMQDQPPRPAHHRNLPADDSIWILMRRCWANKPPARPTMREVLLKLFEYTLNEESAQSSRRSLPSEAEDCAEAFSNIDIDAPGAPKHSSIHWVSFNPDVAECLSSGIPQTAGTRTPIPEDLSTVAREKLKGLQLRSKVVPGIGKYISTVVEDMDRSRDASKCLELSIWKLVTLIQSVEEKLGQHEGDEVPNLVGDIQRELQCVRGKLEGLRSAELVGDAFMLHDGADFTEYQRATYMVLEEVELLVDLNTTYLLTELGMFPALRKGV
ncbi:hypothetical protein FS837_004514 [Tulasnella sp. UAMH 9824]|nr:hypothetical protein FS837_004514 [Tulasnella sp. UAMH 9824]